MTEQESDYVAGDINTVSGPAPTDLQESDDFDEELDDEELDDEEFDEEDDEEEDDFSDDDVNVVGADEDDGVDDMVGNRAEASMPTSLLTFLARALAEEPDAVVVQTERRQASVRLRLHVAPDDMGRIIGRRGRTAQAIRTLVGVAGARDGVQTSVDIVDD
ncbi:MAG TPA: KH domain-containing protein [Acidimicrobiales bacterium]|nr:KH domain-containing protein [Acidimicrobiales bacterium]